MSAAGSNYKAGDAEASTQDGQAAYRPATEAETAYLAARVDDTGAAVKKIRGQIKGLERSLAAAQQEHEDAKASKKAGRDLSGEQSGRAA